MRRPPTAANPTIWTARPAGGSRRPPRERLSLVAAIAALAGLSVVSAQAWAAGPPNGKDFCAKRADHPRCDEQSDLTSATHTPDPTDSGNETASPEPAGTASPEPTGTVSPEPTETVSSEPTETVSPEPTESASTTETASPEPTPSVGCPTDGSQVVLTGEQTERIKDREVADHTSFDARDASWIGVDDYPVRLGGGTGICWQGGYLAGTYPDTDSWDRLHDTAAFSIESPDFTLLDLRVHNYGDGINLKDDARDFVVQRAHLTFVRDDCVENDYVNTGLIEDSLFDGCYTGLSARPSSGTTGVDGTGNVFTVRRSLIRLEPMPTVYKGDAPGHGKFFKWDKEGHGPTLSLHDNVFRADQPPNGSDLSVPAEYLGSCSNNVMVWLGEGDFPGWLPDCFTLTRDQSVWDEAVEEWHARTGG